MELGRQRVKIPPFYEETPVRLPEDRAEAKYFLLQPEKDQVVHIK